MSTTTTTTTATTASGTGGTGSATPSSSSTPASGGSTLEHRYFLVTDGPGGGAVAETIRVTINGEVVREIDSSGPQVIVEVTSSEADNPGVQEYKIWLKRTDDGWRIDRVESVQSLSV